MKYSISVWTGELEVFSFSAFCDNDIKGIKFNIPSALCHNSDTPKQSLPLKYRLRIVKEIPEVPTAFIKSGLSYKLVLFDHMDSIMTDLENIVLIMEDVEMHETRWFIYLKNSFVYELDGIFASLKDYKSEYLKYFFKWKRHLVSNDIHLSMKTYLEKYREKKIQCETPPKRIKTTNISNEIFSPDTKNVRKIVILALNMKGIHKEHPKYNYFLESACSSISLSKIKNPTLTFLANLVDEHLDKIHSNKV
ncbi:hypothetical protein O9G_001125 [Rozella allomycis CSF55]|uniref:Uncharacterized protein n=1 Tax=Rozella allomycis (strain CSF55) TaxID=988480 RepID=A0A075ASA8_ROZAC|nr:hypothetical protein O9G_001125 [Rozella allomycis CSF55]|eukprot:EPZ33156.1 hypothetical protein O9G_001125 [Rozella allomycis CSF55]